jgi:hypothetical protein
MGKLHASIDDALATWLLAQRLFFVATAPSHGGHVNCSPRGGDSLRILGPTTVAWLDRTGSGIETVAHLRQNGRIVLMFCAFEGPPRIVRLHGRGTVLAANTPAFATAAAAFGAVDFDTRAILRIELDRVSDSCGFGVPLYRYEGEREQLGAWAKKKGPDGVAAYVREKNATSIDGLPGLPPPGLPLP